LRLPAFNRRCGREIPLDGGGELLRAGGLGDGATEHAGARQPFAETARVRAHHNRALLRAETFHGDPEQVEQKATLFVGRRVGGDRLAAQRRGGLAKQPWTPQRRAADHHAVHPVARKCEGGGLGRSDVAVAD